MSRLSLRKPSISSKIENINTIDNTSNCKFISRSRAGSKPLMKNLSVRLSTGSVLSERQHVVETELNDVRALDKNLISSTAPLGPDEKGGGIEGDTRSHKHGKKKRNKISRSKSAGSLGCNEALLVNVDDDGCHGDSDRLSCLQSVKAAAINVIPANAVAGCVESTAAVAESTAASAEPAAACAEPTATSAEPTAASAESTAASTEPIATAAEPTAAASASVESAAAAADCVESVVAVSETEAELSASKQALASPHSIVHLNPRTTVRRAEKSSTGTETKTTGAGNLVNAAAVGTQSNCTHNYKVVNNTDNGSSATIVKSKGKTINSKAAAFTNKSAAKSSISASISNDSEAHNPSASSNQPASADKSSISVSTKPLFTVENKLAAQSRAIASKNKAAAVNNSAASDSTAFAITNKTSKSTVSALSKAADKATVNTFEAERTAASTAVKGTVNTIEAVSTAASTASEATDAQKKPASLASDKIMSTTTQCNSTNKPSNSTSTLRSTASSTKSSRRQPGPVPGSFGSPTLARLMTDFYPVRRSSRSTATQLKKRQQDRLEEFVVSQREVGLKIAEFPEKGRGVVTTRLFQRGEFLVEYAGELVEYSEAKLREAMYSQDQRLGCYMYYFTHRDKRFCIDATPETPRLGRLINHSRLKPNCATKIFELDGKPRLIFVSLRQIEAGEELMYDYGDRDPLSMEAHPWLAY